MIDDIVLVHSDTFTRHRNFTPHPENPERLTPLGAWIDSEPPFRDLPRIDATALPQAKLLTAHARGMVERVLGTANRQGWLDPDTYYSPDSLDVAQRAAGACVDAALAIARGEYRRGFCVVRPPGHHATADESMGFCLFNNVSLCAAMLLDRSPQARIAIVDFDLHHGNGTQSIFYGNPNVLVLSSHRYPYYPGTGALAEIGTEKGKGTTINFPLARRWGDELFLPLYARLVAPILRAFAPDFILVSAGFDGHADDPMGGFRLSTSAYGELTKILVASAEHGNGKILFCLEGGYQPQALGDSIREVLRALVETPRTASGQALPRADDDVETQLAAFREFHAPFFPELLKV